MAEADVESPQAAAENPPEEERKAPGYRFPVVEEATARFAVRLPPFPDAPEGFFGSLDRLLACLREGSVQLQNVPLAPVVDQYLGFRERLRTEEAHERVSDFLPLAATLIHLKSQLFLRQARAEIVDEIRRAERRRRERRETNGEAAPADEGPPRLTPLDLLVLLNDVRNGLRAPLTVTDEDLSVRDAMRSIRDSLPENAALAADTYFERCRTRRDRAAVFLAVLELSRHRFLDCRQSEAFAPIWIRRLPEPAGRAAAEPER
jgi:segregation and condensation protein A